MKTRTEIVLVILKYLALVAGIGFSIECGSQIFSFAGSFIDPSWAEKVYKADPFWFRIREEGAWYYNVLMAIIIAISALKAWIWYLIFDLLLKLQLSSPFSLFVTRKLETISYILLAVWVMMALIEKSFGHYLMEGTGIQFPENYIQNEYFFVAGIVFILSQLFKRGVEMQEENQLTV